MKKYEYKEPEFNVVMTGSEDILTASSEVGPTPAGQLGRVNPDWAMGDIIIG